jgi:hypothetical protein
LDFLEPFILEANSFEGAILAIEFMIRLVNFRREQLDFALVICE